MKDYDVSEAFREIELDLIKSMKRNLSRHQKWEDSEGINWTMWQAEQLNTLEEFRKNNKKTFGKRFNGINGHIQDMLQSTYETSGFDQERTILERLKRNGEPIKTKTRKHKNFTKTNLSGSFFSLNEGKMNALLTSTTKDMEKAEHAVLRMTNDQYRKTIFNAQVMANSGAGTLKKSIDKATHDFLSAGINCIEYKNGRRVNIASYAEMAVRTANKRAMLVSEGEVRKAYGIHTVKVSTYGQCSPTCLPFQGKTFIDDVFSGGTKEEAEKLNLPLLSWAIDQGLFHPNCKHRLVTSFPGLENNDVGNPRDNSKILEYENPPEEQEHRKNQLRIQQQKRLEVGSLDEKNIKIAKKRKGLWQAKDNKLKEAYAMDEKGVRMKVRNEEAHISSNSYESALVYDQQGDLLFSKIGTYDSVDFSDKEREFLKDAIVTHNHPGDGPFSPEDIYMVIKNDIQELRASGKRGIFVVRRSENLHLMPTEDVFASEYMELMNEITPKYRDKIKNEGMTKFEANYRILDETVAQLEEKYQLGIKFERRKVNAKQI